MFDVRYSQFVGGGTQGTGEGFLQSTSLASAAFVLRKRGLQTYVSDFQIDPTRSHQIRVDPTNLGCQGQSNPVKVNQTKSIQPAAPVLRPAAIKVPLNYRELPWKKFHARRHSTL